MYTCLSGRQSKGPSGQLPVSSKLEIEWQQRRKILSGGFWPGPEIPPINLIAESQPFDFAWHEEFRCNCHRPLMADLRRSAIMSLFYFSARHKFNHGLPRHSKEASGRTMRISGDSGNSRLVTLRRRHPPFVVAQHKEGHPANARHAYGEGGVCQRPGNALRHH